MASADDVFAALGTALAVTQVRTAIPGDLPTPPGAYPNFKLRLTGETKQSIGRSSIGFNTQVTIRVEGEVSEPVDLNDDVAVSQITAKLTDLKRLAERAIINSYPLFRVVQQLVSVTTQFSYAAEATRLAGIQCDYTFEIFESAEDFFPLEADELLGIDATDPAHPGTGLAVDLAA